MSRKKKRKRAAAVPSEILAEGSGPVETAPDVDALAAAANEALSVEAPSGDVSAETSNGNVVVVVVEAAAEVDMTESIESLESVESVESVEMTESVQAADALELSGHAPEAPVDDATALEAAPTDALEELTDEEAAELGAVLPTSAASMDAVQLKFLVEALVFASDKPITIQRLRQLTRVSDTRRLEQALADVAEDHKDRGIVLQQVSGGYQFRTRTQFSPWVQQLIAGRPVRLSRAQLETLAIVAYRQPITRPEIDEIRGVDSSATLKLLLDRTLIRILGKKEEVGRPMLYGTTKEFLDFFSLGDLRELPTLREYSELTDESRRVMTDELGIDPDAAPIDTTASEEILDEVEPAPLSIEDMVASYNTSMDTTTDEASTTGVFVTDSAIAIDEVDATESTLEALASRRMNADAAARADADEASGTLADDADASAETTAGSDVDASADLASGDVDSSDAAIADLDSNAAMAAADVASNDAPMVDVDANAGDAEAVDVALSAEVDANVDFSAQADVAFAALHADADELDADVDASSVDPTSTVDAAAALESDALNADDAADEAFASLADGEDIAGAEAEHSSTEVASAEVADADIDAASAALDADPAAADEPDSTKD